MANPTDPWGYRSPFSVPDSITDPAPPPPPHPAVTTAGAVVVLGGVIALIYEAIQRGQTAIGVALVGVFGVLFAGVARWLFGSRPP